MRNLRLTLAALTAFSITACSGGGTSSTPVATNPSGGSTTSNPGSGTSGTSKTGGTLAFSLKVYHPTGSAAPSAAARASLSKRSPDYLSYAVQSVVVTLTPTGGTATTTPLDLGTSAFSCSQLAGAEYETCTTDLNATSATGVVSVAAYDAKQNGMINTPPNGNLLGQASITYSVSSGSTTPINVTLYGQPATVDLYLENPSPPVGTSAVIPLDIAALDADGYLIMGNYIYPVTITDTSGASDLVLGSAAAASSVSVSSTSQVVTVSYGGSATPASITYTPSGSNATTFGSAVLTPTAASPTEKIYAHGSNLNGQVGQAVDVFDLGTATSTGTTGSTHNYTVANTLDSFVLTTSSVTITSNQFALSTTGQIAWEDGSGGSGAPIDTQLYASLAVPATAGAATIVASNPTNTFSGAGGATSFAGAYIPHTNLFLQPVDSNDTGILGTYPDYINTLDTPAITTFTLSDGFPGGGSILFSGYNNYQFDPNGNLWVGGNNGLDEYSASSVVNATQGSTINPVTQIKYGTATGQIPPISSDSIDEIAFAESSSGALLALYLVSQNGTIIEFPSTILGTSAATTGTAFTPADAPFGIAVDPASGNIIVTGAGGLAFYQGINAHFTNGSSQTPYERITLPESVGGQIYLQQ